MDKKILQYGVLAKELLSSQKCNVYLLHLHLVYHWGWSHRNFKKIFGTHKPETLGYHVAQFADLAILTEHWPVTYRWRDMGP